MTGVQSILLAGALFPGTAALARHGWSAYDAVQRGRHAATK